MRLISSAGAGVPGGNKPRRRQYLFSNAVVACPGQQTGNVFYATTRLLVWPSQPAGSNFLNRLAVTNAGRDIYNWTALPPRDTNGVPPPTTGVNANDSPPCCEPIS